MAGGVTVRGAGETFSPCRKYTDVRTWRGPPPGAVGGTGVCVVPGVPDGPLPSRPGVVGLSPVVPPLVPSVFDVLGGVIPEGVPVGPVALPHAVATDDTSRVAAARTIGRRSR
ncbi:hypothetical protein [Streptomyces sp. WAC 01325]|uniref:hypothetical protein n=1 Tax=Streptomyces sp. WAC 01325 TaxID=2203202 RepID=UPI0021AFF283|nr:hypothetical protein [Streptomyces sp. WAC 01325]